MAAAVATKGLSSKDVDNLCSRVASIFPGVVFLGVTSAHSLPPIETLAQDKHLGKKVFFVANNEVKEESGEHWVCFYFPPAGSRRDKPFLFDSFGRRPEDMGHADWCDYMAAVTMARSSNNSREWKRQQFEVQQRDTSVCGILCAYYMYLKCLGYRCAFPHKRIVSPQELEEFIGTIQ